MNVVFKFKVLGFCLALMFGALVHIVFGMMPGKKSKPSLGSDLEVFELDSDLRY